MNKLVSFWTDESGQGSTGYAVIIALALVLLLLVVIAFREEISDLFDLFKDDMRTRPRVR